MAKVTLSVPDDLYEKLEKYRDRLNYSEIFRRAVLEEIEKLEEKGELIKGLESYLSEKPPTIEDIERIRREELERFTRKWGTPDRQSKTDRSPPYIELSKWQEVKRGGRTITRLYISNSSVLAERVVDLDRRGFGKYTKEIQELYPKEIQDVVEYFRSKGFIVVEDGLDQDLIALFVTGGDRNAARELQYRGYYYRGLFATDQEKRDWVFIAYRVIPPRT